MEFYLSHVALQSSPWGSSILRSARSDLIGPDRLRHGAFLSRLRAPFLDEVRPFRVQSDVMPAGRNSFT